MAIWNRVLHWFYRRRLNRLTKIIVKNELERKLQTELNSQICTTREQSVRLLSLGLEKETADMAIFEYLDFCPEDNCNYPTGEYEVISRRYAKNFLFSRTELTPAWSLDRLWKLMPEVVFSKPALYLTMCGDSVFYCTEDNNEDYEKPFSGQLNIYDNIIDCIEWLIKNGYIGKEYIAI